MIQSLQKNAVSTSVLVENATSACLQVWTNGVLVAAQNWKVNNMEVSNVTAIRNLGWACYNRCVEFVTEVYCEGSHPSYLNEKIGIASRNPMAWFLDLDDGHRDRAVSIANKYYSNKTTTENKGE